jgi:hypothetical protein
MRLDQAGLGLDGIMRTLTYNDTVYMKAAQYEAAEAQNQE